MLGIYIPQYTAFPFQHVALSTYNMRNLSEYEMMLTNDNDNEEPKRPLPVCLRLCLCAPHTCQYHGRLRVTVHERLGSYIPYKWNVSTLFVKCAQEHI